MLINIVSSILLLNSDLPIQIRAIYVYKSEYLLHFCTTHIDQLKNSYICFYVDIQECPENEEATNCKKRCPPESCETFGKQYKCRNDARDSCVKGCKCKKDYRRNALGICVPSEQCGEEHFYNFNIHIFLFQSIRIC